MRSVCAPFLAAGERPAIVAQANCPRRFARYRAMHGWNARINQRQFGLPRAELPVALRLADGARRRRVAHDASATSRCTPRAARGETDDGLFVWLPARRHLFCGDLIIWQAPNCGNPQKVQRYPVDWAEALERMAALDAEWLFPGHGLVVDGHASRPHVLPIRRPICACLIEQVRTA